MTASKQVGKEPLQTAGVLRKCRQECRRGRGTVDQAWVWFKNGLAFGQCCCVLAWPQLGSRSVRVGGGALPLGAPAPQVHGQRWRLGGGTGRSKAAMQATRLPAAAVLLAAAPRLRAPLLLV